MASIPLDKLRSDSRPRAAVVVAHPDRAPRFRRVLERLGAEGEMADLDDGPDQAPLPMELVRETIARLLAGTSYSLILTHGPKGEYTRHRRHAECFQTVVELWRSDGFDTRRLWLFAYEDRSEEHTS